jgi:hypothetical protein
VADDVSQYAVQAGPDIYYNPSFMRVLDDHMTYLRQHPKTTTMTVQPIQAARYRFDLRGLFIELAIPAQFHYVVMRMNQLTSFQDVPETLTDLLVPDETVVTTLASVARSTTTLKG